MQFIAVILAAGKSSRMLSSTPKVLLNIAGIPLIEYILITLKNLSIPACVVVNDEIENHRVFLDLKDKYNFSHVLQQEKLGTADALSKALPKCKNAENILVLCGDAPLVSSESIAKLLDLHIREDSHATCLCFEAKNPHGYGRVYTKNGFIEHILEEEQCNELQKCYNLCNSGTMTIKNLNLREALGEIAKLPNKEHFLTEIYNILVNKGLKCCYSTAPEGELMGVNTLEQLEVLEKHMQKNIVAKHRRNGVRIINPDTSYFAYSCTIERDVIIYPNVYIGPNVYIKEGSVIHSFSWLEGAAIGRNNIIGPFARIRNGTHTDEGVKIGNFVEVKKAEIGAESKASHLAYLGDTKMGSNVNIGAGAVICNYDGYNKYKTIIKDGVFVGCNSSLISPIIIEKNAMIAAGSVVTKSCAEDDLVIARTPQKNLPKKAKSLRLKQQKKAPQK
jgi:bifunctional UDP-N-acetylglucosamine pyrophosphorylase / glucosamine-1-phosphate N-acetyltransferase